MNANSLQSKSKTWGLLLDTVMHAAKYFNGAVLDDDDDVKENRECIFFIEYMSNKKLNRCIISN